MISKDLGERFRGRQAIDQPHWHLDSSFSGGKILTGSWNPRRLKGIPSVIKEPAPTEIKVADGAQTSESRKTVCLYQ
jgi:hypothetical protein